MADLAKKLLMIAYHYPPYRGGSGVHRTLKFSSYLPNHGWQPLVLSAHPRAFASVGDDQLKEIPPQAIVERPFALDSSRHLSIKGRYPRLLALPDPWISWWFGAVVAGLRMVRCHRPQAIWSTYPVATAHLIGYTLHRLTGLPWVADFRDSMTEDDYPRDKWSRECYLWIERRAVRFAARLVFTTPSTRQMYRQRYPQLSERQSVLISNGYDEEDFVGIAPAESILNGASRPLRILHSGLVYPDERDPRSFFSAIARLKAQGAINAATLTIDLRASGSEEYYRNLIAQLGIGDIVRILPAIPHRQALQECADADALLLFQAASCNHQIPAKTYEYLRIGKPILALTPDAGDTAAVLREAGGATVIDLADENTIMNRLPRFISQVRLGTHPLPDVEITKRSARSWQAAELAQCLNSLVAIA